MKKEIVDRIYTRRARWFGLTHALVMRGQDDVWRREAGRMCRPPEGGRVVEFCAGQSHSAVACLEEWEKMGLRDVRVTGIERNEKMLEMGKVMIAKSRWTGRVELVRGDVENLREGEAERGMAMFANEIYDAGYCVFGLGGLEDRPAALAEMLRVLKPGARAVFVDSHPMEGGLGGAPERWRRDWMGRTWGWEDISGMREEISAARWTDAAGVKHGFVIESQKTIPLSRLLLKTGISAVSGVRVAV